MCDCLSFPIAPWSKLWRHAIFHLCLKLGSWPRIYPVIEIELLGDASSSDSPHAQDDPYLYEKSLGTSREDEPARRAVYLKHPQERKAAETEKKIVAKRSVVSNDVHQSAQNRYASNGGSTTVSLFTKQGLKGINQDAMLVWEKFASQKDTVFCGVFDGHGPHGHRVARNVRDMLPQKLASSWQAQQWSAKEASFSSDDSEAENCSLEEGQFSGEIAGDPCLITAWKESIVTAYKLMDRELLINEHVDCVSSGTTAVTLIKQGSDLIVGNVGDSRAVLGMRADDDSFLALQLTVDLKPNVPREAERIKRRKGRVFALRNEPLVHRVWLPNHNTPGLAMARALGDYCLKNYGVISEPEVTYRRLTKKDEFVVLATDGVWDVLTNEQVVEMVASSPERSLAARTVVEGAVRAWKSKHANPKVDDCAVVCLFL